LIYAILITSRKLKPYFDGHHIMVTTSFLLEDIIHNNDANGRIVKWAMELCPFSMDVDESWSAAYLGVYPW
jgi:hypothetical protein